MEIKTFLRVSWRDHRERAALFAIAGWFCFCFAHFLSFYYSAFPGIGVLTGFLLRRTAVLLLSLALFWLAAWSVGDWLLKALGVPGALPIERWLLALGLGAGALGLTALALGLCGLLYPKLLVAILFGLAFMRCASIARAVMILSRKSFSVPDLRFTGIPIAALIFCGLYVMLQSTGPQIFYDSLVYHLALPALYLRHARIFATPFNIYSGIPLGIEALYLWLLPLDAGGSLCQLLHWSLGALTAAAIVAIGRRLGSLKAGLWAAAIFYVNPMVLLIGRKAGVELGSSFYVVLALLAAVLYCQRLGLIWIVWSGAFAGLALGTKYQLITLLPGMAAFLAQTQGWRTGLRSFSLAALIAVSLAAPWGFKNMAFYQNPVYPFFAHRFNPKSVIQYQDFAGSAHARPWENVGIEGDLDHFSPHLWTYSANSELDNLLSLVFLLLIPVFFYYGRAGPAQALFLFWAAMWFPLNALAGLARFSIPSLGPLSLALAFALISLPSFAARLTQGVVGLAFVFCAIAAFNLDGMKDYWRALEAPRGVSDYLKREHASYPNPPYAAFDWANSYLPPNAKLLLIGEQRPFYLERDSFPASIYVEPPLLVWIKDSSSSEELYRRIAREGVTHIFVNVEELKRLDAALVLSKKERARLNGFWRRHVERIKNMRSDPSDDFIYHFAFYKITPMNAEPGAPAPSFLLKKPKRAPRLKSSKRSGPSSRFTQF